MKLFNYNLNFCVLKAGFFVNLVLTLLFFAIFFYPLVQEWSEGIEIHFGVNATLREALNFQSFFSQWPFILVQSLFSKILLNIKDLH